MPLALRHPGVYIQEIPSGVRTITGVSTSITLVIGWATRGAEDRAERVFSFSEFECKLGGLDARSLLGYSVKHFFDNGGQDAYVVRLVHEDAERASTEIEVLTVSASSRGSWANDLEIRITHRPDDDTHFRLAIAHAPSNQVLESFENLSMDLADPRYISSVINENSTLIRVEVQNPEDQHDRPSELVSALSNSSEGSDGPVLRENTAEFHAALDEKLSAGGVIEHIDLFNIVCVPGETDSTTIANLQNLCVERRAFLIVDSNQDATLTSLENGADSGMTTSNALNSAMYFPWVRAPDPLQQGRARDFPPCGFVAGIYARTDGQRGVWKAPAGTEANIVGAVGLTLPLSDAENGVLNPLGINCLRNFPVFGNIVWGARTLHGQDDRGSEWKYTPVKRTALFIEESLFRGTQWVVFEPNDEPLWAQIRLNIGAFMQNLFRQGAFQGRSPREAYFVKCDSETTTQNDINLGIVNILVGFAPLKPAEFVVIKIQQMAGQIAV
jgi:phage tail sheath protein FI